MNLLFMNLLVSSLMKKGFKVKSKACFTLTLNVRVD